MPDKLDVVRKLLAKAERAGTPEEADTYTAKALELMARHGIDDALLAEKDPTLDEITTKRYTIDDPYSVQKAELLNCVAMAYRCRVVVTPEGRRVPSAMLFGYRSDIERVDVLFTSLLLQATHEMLRVATPPRERQSFRRTWMAGFTSRIWRRLEEVKRTVERDTEKSTALVLVDRSTRVEKAMIDMFGGLSSRAASRLNGRGFDAGWKAGGDADLGQTRVGANRTMIT